MLSYLYHPVMIRYLSIEEFGTFESILSVVNLIWVFITALGLFYLKEVSKIIDDLEYAKAYRRITLKYIFIILCFLT